MDMYLAELVAIPSVCSNVTTANQIIDVTEQKLRGYGMYVERFSCNNFPSFVATTRKTKTPKVMLYAHLDVVDAPKNLFSLRLEGGKYYGRGVLDMKSAAAAYLHVLEGLGSRLKDYDIGVMFTTDEEYFGDYGAKFLTDKGYIPEVCIMPDSGFGTKWQIESFAKGCWFAHITALGISAHGSRPWEGDSASIKLVQAMNDITRLFKDAQKPETATLNIGMLQGGKSVNQIPAAAMASMDIRFCDMKSLHMFHKKILRICDKYGVNLKTVREWNEPTISDIEHPLVVAFTKHVALQTGIVPKPFSAHGATDARFFRAHDVPCVLMAPPGNGAHSNDEWLDEQGYEQFKLILRDYLDEVAIIGSVRQSAYSLIE
jgi:acetylornithine deacetylase/succinyl-diaminopimelate desuccinylase-like protein